MTEKTFSDMLQETSQSPVPMLSILPRSINATLETQVAQAVQKVVGEKPEFGVGLVAMPGPEGQPMPVAMIVLAVPSLALGDKIQAALMIQNLWPGQEDVDRLVSETTEQLLQARSQQGQGLG